MNSDPYVEENHWLHCWSDKLSRSYPRNRIYQRNTTQSLSSSSPGSSGPVEGPSTAEHDTRHQAPRELSTNKRGLVTSFAQLLLWLITGAM
jgi:hypothetical protein